MNCLVKAQLAGGVACHTWEFVNATHQGNLTTGCQDIEKTSGSDSWSNGCATIDSEFNLHQDWELVFQIVKNGAHRCGVVENFPISVGNADFNQPLVFKTAGSNVHYMFGGTILMSSTAVASDIFRISYDATSNEVKYYKNDVLELTDPRTLAIDTVKVGVSLNSLNTNIQISSYGNL